MRPIGQEYAELGILSKTLEGRSHPSAIAVAIPRIFIEDDFLVPAPETVFAIATDCIGSGITVMVRPVLRVGVEMEEHIICKINHVEVVLNALVISGASDVSIRKAHHLVPPTTASAEVFVDFPVFLGATKMLRPEIVLKALSEIVESEIKAVDVEVDEIAVARRLSHVAQALLHPDISKILRVVRSVSVAGPGDQSP